MSTDVAVSLASQRIAGLGLAGPAQQADRHQPDDEHGHAGDRRRHQHQPGGQSRSVGGSATNQPPAV